MSDQKSPNPESERDSKLTAVKSRTVLDSIFSDSGPMPPAKLWIRSLSFLLDFILLTAVASVIIWKILIPQAYPGAFAELMTWSETVVNSFMSASQGTVDPTKPEISNYLAEALAYARDIQLLIFWVYFALGEAFFKGTTLGKRACRLRSVSTVTLSHPPIVAGIVRGGLKTLALFVPIGLIATVLVLFFNKRRQMGHDLLSRTVVIDEKTVNLPQMKSPDLHK